MNLLEYIALGTIITLAVIHIVRKLVKTAKGEGSCSMCKKCVDSIKDNKEGDSDSPAPCSGCSAMPWDTENKDKGEGEDKKDT